ncbi:hypothetical protein [Rothia aeria]|uniref:hypothetical protein n=1 Tax=Rothia aeria TaxID=172042 RepID=UPI0028D8A591|nr:hypothetical protein [Rothia aeria]
MPEEHETIEARLSASPEVYRHTKFMARFEKAFPWLLAGGAALGLLETYRKNTNDRAKANADIKAALKNQEHQAEVLKEQIRQFDENAFKERKAERRERYTKAVEQLGDEKAPVRMGGVYTLVGLVDEWLEEKSLSDDERFKEGQVIINNLCAYIRSPFTLTSYYDELSEDAPSLEGSYKDKKEEFYVDKAILDSEADVRLSIIKEIHDRIQVPDKNTPGAWSDFEYDFSGSTFFYPIDLTNSYYAKPINFSGSTYKGWANFTDSTYQALANFRGSTYQALANFRGSTYQGWANFRGSTYQGEAYFTDSTYQGWANFRGSTYQGEAYFTDSTYQGWANFSDSTYNDVADFSGSIFYQKVYFGADGDNSSFSRFTDCAPQFYDETNRKNTLFGSPNNDFTVENGRGYPIYRNLEGLPLGCAFLTAEQKEYLADKFQEIDETKNKFREVKDTEGNAILVNTPLSLNGEIRVWREKVTTVKAEDNTAPEKEDN